MKCRSMTPFTRYWIMAATAFALIGGSALGQTQFFDFNSVGQYTNDFSPWNDNGGGNGLNYSFEESATAGVGGSGGVSVFANNDMTAVENAQSWDLSKNGASAVVSVMIHTDGQTSGDKVQLGFMNTAANGLNSNPGVEFESFRFVPGSPTTWNVYEQYRISNGTVSPAGLGTVSVITGHWYKFVVGMTNTSGATGNYSAGCGLIDYGTDGLTPGTNAINFSTATTHGGPSVATNAAVWPALRAFQDAGIDAWDNFAVYTASSLPVFTLKFGATKTVAGATATFQALADGPGTITYSWFTNGTPVSGVSGTTYSTPPLTTAFTNVAVVARNANGAVTNSAPVSVVTASAPQVEIFAATNVQSSTAALGGQVLSTGGISTSVYLYYGTNDGRNDPTAWAQMIPLGPQSGAFSQAVTLDPATTYYFTAEASNAVGVAWATPATFTTLAAPGAISFFGDGENWTVNQEGLDSGIISGNVLNGTTGGQNQWVTAWYNDKVYINGFSASFIYQNVNGSPGNDADGASFDLQESGPSYLNSEGGASGGSLGIFDLAPSADWEINIYGGNGIGIGFNVDGATGGYFPTGNVDVAGGDPIQFTIAYAPGGAVQETLVDTATGDSFATNYDVGDLTALLGSSYAYVGVTASSGGVGGAQNISDFAYQTGSNGFTAAVVTDLPASDVQPTTATLNGDVLTNGGFAPTITIYYGPGDGGTNAVNWANSVRVGVENGAFSNSVTGLSPSTKYYYRAEAVNLAGTSWAGTSSSFTTSTASRPQVVNAAATSIGGTFATLNGNVVSTGGAPTTVTLYYGPADGGTTAGAWANSLSFAAAAGPFQLTVGSLVTNTAYYFTAWASNLAGAAWASPSLSFRTLAANPVVTATAVLTYHNDNTRAGVNDTENILTPANVNTNNFGRLFSYAVDGFVYAQPLIMTNVNIPGKGLHNVVYVATEHNSVYAFDADSNDEANAAPLWQTSFLGPGVTTVPAGQVGSSDITPEIGITSTPVIDPVSGTLYVEVKTLEQGVSYVHRLHALDIATGAERSNWGSPVVIQCTNYVGFGTGDNDGENPPHVLWNPFREHCRPAMTLLHGWVYMSFASHGDNGPYHGWFFGYNATNLAQAPQVYNATPNGAEGGFWDGGGGPTVDAQGNMYFQTGNGSFDEVTGVTSSNNYAMSLVKLSTTNGLKMADFFAPSNAVSLSDGDQDLGSAAPIILPDSSGSVAHPHLVVGGGKTAPIYLVDRDNMGRFRFGNDNQIVQQFNGGPYGDRDVTPAFFNNTLYIMDGNGRLAGYTISNAQFNTTPMETPDGYDNKGGATACVSANGTSNAIVWALYNSGGETPTGPCVLRAYNATNLAQELYASDQIPSRDSAGSAVKFIAPTIADGKVYVGAQYSLTVYGLAQSFVATPAITPEGGVFTNSVQVTLSDSTAGARIYYTLDGSTPTTNSTLYTGPFTLTASAAVTAAAFKAGAVASGTATASFLDSSSVGTGTGLLGNYWANTASGTFLQPGFNAAPTLTRVDPTVDFNWDASQPAPNIGPDTYVAQWTGAVEPQFSGTYTFSTTTDDGVLLRVNGQLLVNAWVDQAPTTWSGTIHLQARQRYNIVMDYYQNGGGAVAQLAWSSALQGPTAIIPETQLYPVSNPPPAVTLTGPANGSVFTASASVSMVAEAAAQYNTLSNVSFYVGSSLAGSATNAPYGVTVTGLAAGTYTLTAVATDGSGLATTSAPVSITVNAGTGQPYGMSAYPAAPAFYNMPPVFGGPMPATLSLTGVFSNTAAMIPQATLIPYSPNVPLWSDGAQKVRYLSVPHSGAALTPGQQISFAPTFTWSFPAGTIFVKTFELATNQSDPAALRRLETRLLVRDTNGAVYGVTYKWRADNSDADLLTGSLTEPIPIQTPSGVITQMWYYPSPSDCLQCHTAPANYVLGLNTRQLNGNLTYPNGVTDNQLRTLNRVGLFYPAIDSSSIPNLEQLSAVTNAAASLEQRARSYLDANCAQCHVQPGGSGPTFDARYDIPLAQQNITNTPAVKGNFGYDNVDIVRAHDIWRSSLYDRMNSLDPAIKMPSLARNLIDSNAVALMAQWINSLPGTPALAPPTISPSSGTEAGYVDVTVQPSAAGETLHYTLDGTTPTATSLTYTGPLRLTNDTIFNVNAWETGFADSVIASAQYSIVAGPYFAGPGSFVNGGFEMSFVGTAGASYVLQTSTNLLQWTSVATNVANVSPFTLIDTNAPSAERFYRVIQLP